MTGNKGSRMIPVLAITATLAAVFGFSACAPLLIGGAAVGGAMMYADRRSSGAQVEDQAIELKAGRRIGEVMGERGHINVTSYNRIVLLTGEVPVEADRAIVEQAIARVDNVRSIANELAVAPNSSFGARSQDTVLTSKVKATFVDTKDLQANAIKVVTEASEVFLMGRVTEREAARAAQLARAVPGVRKVVRVFEVVSEAELADLLPKSASAPAK